MGNRIEWKGGECPVSDYTKVRVWYRNGVIPEGDACEFSWRHEGFGYGGDIISYEVIEEAKEDKQITEKTLWDEYALAWMTSGVWGGMTTEEAMKECAAIADAMMKARAK